MAALLRIDPLTNYKFLVEIDGLVVGGFTEITGLQAEMDIEEYQEGGMNSYAHKLPKASKFPNLILKRGLTYSDTLWKWYQDAASGQVKRKSGSVLLLDYSGSESWRWNFYQAYPVKWKGPELHSDNGGVAFETIELAHNGFSKEG
jgi:phage tail-like protein